MMIFDKNYTNLYNGDCVTYKGKQYDITILDDGINLSSVYEELFIKCKNNYVLEDIEVYVDMNSIESDSGLFGY